MGSTKRVVSCTTLLALNINSYAFLTFLNFFSTFFRPKPKIFSESKIHFAASDCMSRFLQLWIFISNKQGSFWYSSSIRIVLVSVIFKHCSGFAMISDWLKACLPHGDTQQAIITTSEQTRYYTCSNNIWFS